MFSAGDARHVVVLGEPEALEVQALDVAGELDGAQQRLARVGPGADARNFEYGKWNASQ